MRRATISITAIVSTFALLAGPAVAAPGQGQAPDGAEGKGQGLENPNVVEFHSVGHEFFGLPEEIPSGWTTFRYHNRSSGEHFAYIADLPEGRSSQDSVDEVVPVFQDAMDLIRDGSVDDGFAKLGELPEWSGEVVPMGGPGLVAPGAVAETTVYLEPGNHQIECYVLSDGEFHTWTMIEDLTVVDEPNGAREPVADFEVVLDDQGLEIEGDVRPGQRTFAVHFEEQTVHGNGLGHDVHVARLDESTDLDELNDWMDWSNPPGLDGAAPAEFVGGAQTMTEGSTAYVSLHLKPGEYAFISEIDDPASSGFLEVVTIP